MAFSSFGVRHSFVIGYLGVWVFLLSGCSDGRPQRVPVSGQVLIDGDPVRGGVVQVIPKNARPANGMLDEEGRFTLTTFDKEDGCVLGTHNVMVMAVREEGTRDYWMAPKKYSSPVNSGLTTTIDGPTDSLTIELTT